MTDPIKWKIHRQAWEPLVRRVAFRVSKQARLRATLLIRWPVAMAVGERVRDHIQPDLIILADF